MLAITEIEIVQAKKQRRVRVDWTLAEDKALLGLMEDKELDMGDRAEALAAQGFLKRSKNAVQHRWSRIKHRKLTPEQEKKMEAKKNSGESVVVLGSPNLWLLHVANSRVFCVYQSRRGRWRRRSAMRSRPKRRRTSVSR